MRFFITGVAGTGKSTVARVLTAHGYKGVDIDAETTIAGSVNIHTGERETVPNPRPIGWAPNHKWMWDDEKLREYLSSQNDDVFLCGFAWNQADFYDIFDKVFVLTLDDKTLTDRIITRTNNSFGKHPHELATTLGLNRTLTQSAIAAGAVSIEASRDLETVMNEIVRIAYES
jgi:broad-specificity NMP kinase